METKKTPKPFKIYNPDRWLNSLRIKPIKAPTMRKPELKKLIRAAQLEAGKTITALEDSDNPQCIKTVTYSRGKAEAYEEILLAIENNPVLLKLSGERL